MIDILVVVLGLFLFWRKWMKGIKCPVSKDMTGRIIVVTGANRGIGKETVLALARMGAQLVMLCRDMSSGQQVLKQVKEYSKASRLFKLDLSSFKSVRECAQQLHKNYDRIDIMLHNAGIICHEKSVTQDGLQKTKQINFSGAFLLTNLLWDLIKKGQDARVISVNSLVHRCNPQGLSVKPLSLRMDDFNFQKRSYIPLLSYSESKLANMAFMNQLANRCVKAGVDVKCMTLHPGISGTDLFARQYKYSQQVKTAFNQIFKTNEQAAQTSIYLSVVDRGQLIHGGYYDDCRPANALPVSEEQLGLMWQLAEKVSGGEFIVK